MGNNVDRQLLEFVRKNNFSMFREPEKYSMFITNPIEDVTLGFMALGDSVNLDCMVKAGDHECSVSFFNFTATTSIEVVNLSYREWKVKAFVDKSQARSTGDVIVNMNVEFDGGADVKKTIPEHTRPILQRICNGLIRMALTGISYELRHKNSGLTLADFGYTNFTLKNAPQPVQVNSENESKPIIPFTVPQQNAARRNIFWVFQGHTYGKECRGGYIWAPVSNKNGQTFHHWTRLLDVREGDIILHGCDGMLKAISIARGACFDCKQPPELALEGLWDPDGRMVKCDYLCIDDPIKTASFVSDIIRLSGAKYSPFTQYGGGNMGYLYEINRELAKIFVDATVRKNPRMKTIPVISELLEEDK